LHWMDCGGSGTTVGKIQVFALRDGHPTIIQQIEYDRHAAGVSDSFEPWNGRLIIVGRSNDPSPNCCASRLDVMRFDWNGARFVLKVSKKIPSIESELESVDPP
jgi:hypothetical protein